MEQGGYGVNEDEGEEEEEALRVTPGAYSMLRPPLIHQPRPSEWISALILELG